jgi:hypothetical protein
MPDAEQKSRPDGRLFVAAIKVIALDPFRAEGPR